MTSFGPERRLPKLADASLSWLTKLDPVRLGLIWQRLNGIVDRVSETFVVRRSRPWFGIIMIWRSADRQGRQFVQSRRSIPSYGALPRTLEAVLAKFPAETLRPGDIA